MACFRSSRLLPFISENRMYGLLKPLSRKKLASASIRSWASMPKSSPSYLENLTHFMGCLLIKLPPLPPLWILFRVRRLLPAFLRPELALLRAADTPMRIKPFQNELARRRAHRIRLVRRQTQRARFFHQPLNRIQLRDQTRRIHVGAQS